MSKYRCLVAAACLLAFTSPVSAEGCVIADAALQCGANARDHEKVAAAFAAQETAVLLKSPLDHLDKFSSAADRETFRRSLEAVWASVNRDERRKRSAYLRGRLSSNEYSRSVTAYRSARQNYDSALGLYRTLKWHHESIVGQ